MCRNCCCHTVLNKPTEITISHYTAIKCWKIKFHYFFFLISSILFFTLLFSYFALTMKKKFIGLYLKKKKKKKLYTAEPLCERSNVVGYLLEKLQLKSTSRLHLALRLAFLAVTFLAHITHCIVISVFQSLSQSSVRQYAFAAVFVSGQKLIKWWLFPTHRYS